MIIFYRNISPATCFQTNITKHLSGSKRNIPQIFDSYLKNGFTEAGFLKESVNYDKNFEDPVHSIRRQSEGLYAIFHFLAYEKEKGRKHPEWEQRLKNMLNMFLNCKMLMVVFHESSVMTSRL